MFIIHLLVVLAAITGTPTVADDATWKPFRLRVNYQGKPGQFENRYLVAVPCTDRNNDIYCLIVPKAGSVPKTAEKFNLFFGSLNNKDQFGTYVSSYEVYPNSSFWVYRGSGAVDGTLAFKSTTKQLYSRRPTLNEKSWRLCPGPYSIKPNHRLALLDVEYGEIKCDKVTITKVPYKT